MFTYSDGRLYWAASGKRAGCLRSDGYRRVAHKDKRCLEHRIVFEMHGNVIPEGKQIDHINRVRDDNRIENLRCVTHAQNQGNNGAVGFTWDKGVQKWRAQIQVDGKRTYLGIYDTPIDARAAYLRAKRTI